MSAAEPRAERTALERFRRLMTITLFVTFALVIIGGVVRVSDSGLGCGPAGSGTYGWPLCKGGPVPSVINPTVLIEYLHRVVAGIVGALVAYALWFAWRHLREHRGIIGVTAATLFLVLIQAALGGLTVEQNLREELVAAHLGLAMLLIGALLWLRRAADEARPDALPGSSRGLRTVAIVACGLVLATIIAGGYVAGTEGHGRANAPVSGAHMACGPEFPTCLGSFMPFGRAHLIDAHLTHRAFMYVAALAVLGLFVAVRRRGIRHPLFTLAVVMLFAQILLGAVNVWAGKHAGLIVGHLTLGTLLWGTLIAATTMLAPAAATVRGEIPRERPAGGGAQAVTA